MPTHLFSAEITADGWLIDDLNALRDRFEKAETPSRQLDACFFAAFYGWSYPLRGAASVEFEALEREARAGFSRSTDPIYDLMASDFPEFHAMVSSPTMGKPWEAVVCVQQSARFVYVSHAQGRALALGAALLKAVVAKKEREARDNG